MSILIIELDTPAGEILAKTAGALADGGSIHIHRDVDQALAKLRQDIDQLEFLLICADDSDRLNDAFSRLTAAEKARLPTLILSACTSIETAVRLLKDGAENFIVRDDSGNWHARLQQVIEAIRARVSKQRDRSLPEQALQAMTRQKRIEETLGEKETLLRQIVQCSSVATFVIDSEHQVTHWNRAAEILLGRSAESAIGTRDIASEVYREQRPVLADLVLDGASEQELARYYGDHVRKSPTIEGVVEAEGYFPYLPNRPRWLHFAAAPLHDDQGRTIGAIETLIDISERKAVEARLRDSERQLGQIIDGSAVAAFVIDRQHRVTHWNRACASLTGVSAENVIGTCEQWRAFYPAERPCLADLVVDELADRELTAYYATKQLHRSRIVEGGYEAQDFFPAFGNGGRWLYFTAAPLRDNEGKVVGAIETLQDITEQKLAEERLRDSEERYRVLSITDGMTGLFNARHFAQRLREEMERSERYRHPLALMVMDVDNFKQFNDTWGHVEGDQVLIRLAECITACLRRTDQAFRYGGEEFVVLLPDTDMEAAMAAAERVRSMFADSEISPAADSSVRCTASIGVTLFIPGESPRDFVARADSGTYEAKRQGKNRVIRIMPRVGDLPD